MYRILWVVQYVTDGSKNTTCFINYAYQMRGKEPIAFMYTLIHRGPYLMLLRPSLQECD
jgi:hypothetical protein